MAMLYLALIERPKRAKNDNNLVIDKNIINSNLAKSIVVQ